MVLAIALSWDRLGVRRTSALGRDAWTDTYVPRDARLVHSSESHGHWIVVYITIDDHVFLCIVHPEGEADHKEMTVQCAELGTTSVPSATPSPEFRPGLLSSRRECTCFEYELLPKFRGQVDIAFEESVWPMGAPSPSPFWREVVSFELKHEAR